MSRRRRIYEGKAKVLYEGPEPGTLIQHFKDDATAFNAKKHQVIEGKGVLNNRISEYLFQHLNDIGVPTHFIRRLNMREQLIREVEIIPLEVVVRNVAAGSLSQRLGIEEGTQLPRSIIEFYYKNDALGDPMVSEEHITAFGWATPPIPSAFSAPSIAFPCGSSTPDFKVTVTRARNAISVRQTPFEEVKATGVGWLPGNIPAIRAQPRNRSPSMKRSGAKSGKTAPGLRGCAAPSGDKRS